MAASSAVRRRAAELLVSAVDLASWRAANANREAKETNREAKEVEATDGREGKRRKSASKAEEDAALDGP